MQAVAAAKVAKKFISPSPQAKMRQMRTVQMKKEKKVPTKKVQKIASGQQQNPIKMFFALKK